MLISSPQKIFWVTTTAFIEKTPKQQYIKGSLPNLICRGLEEEIQLSHSVSTDVSCLVKCRHSSMLSAFARLRLCISSDTEMEMPPCLRNTTYVKQQVSLFHPLPKPTSTRFARSKAQKAQKILQSLAEHLVPRCRQYCCLSCVLLAERKRDNANKALCQHNKSEQKISTCRILPSART